MVILINQWLSPCQAKSLDQSVAGSGCSHLRPDRYSAHEALARRVDRSHPHGRVGGDPSALGIARRGAPPEVRAGGERGRLARRAGLHQEQGRALRGGGDPQAERRGAKARDHLLPRRARGARDGAARGLVAGRARRAGVGALPPGGLRGRGRRLPRRRLEHDERATGLGRRHRHRRRTGRDRARQGPSLRRSHAHQPLRREPRGKSGGVSRLEEPVHSHRDPRGPRADLVPRE